MNKLINLSLLISIMVLFQYNIFAKPYQPQVKGGFKSCTVTEYRYKPGKIVLKNGEMSYAQNFDAHGNQIELIYYENNKISSKNKVENKYNTAGLLSESVYFDKTGKVSTKFTYSYDDKTNLIGNVTYNAKGEVTERGSYVYDKNDFMIEETHEVKIGENEFYKGTTKYINDAHGNKIAEIAVRSSNVSVSASSEQNLENNENKSEVKTEESAAPPDTVKYEYVYDVKGRIAKETRIGVDGFKFVKGYKYDAFGNLKEQIYFDENNKPVMTTVFEFK
ncbi:MAG: hypothetical protein A2X64_06915 [Ignavibacteria bacterium GWF2_33_9]|nr:MAG: hypothetical protein A2X64_06915 [Ignavibacteria bacterium GWF2_33_9]